MLASTKKKKHIFKSPMFARELKLCKHKWGGGHWHDAIWALSQARKEHWRERKKWNLLYLHRQIRFFISMSARACQHAFIHSCALIGWTELFSCMSCITSVSLLAYSCCHFGLIDWADITDRINPTEIYKAEGACRCIWPLLTQNTLFLC